MTSFLASTKLELPFRICVGGGLKVERAKICKTYFPTFDEPENGANLVRYAHIALVFLRISRKVLIQIRQTTAKLFCSLVKHFV